MKLPKLFAFRGSPKFTTDGCSGYMTWLWLAIFGHAPPWNGCCIAHDAIYWLGGVGTSRQWTRAQADRFLFNCIAQKGYRKIAWLCWIGTRVGGSRLLPFSWRWRYRESYWDALTGRVT